MQVDKDCSEKYWLQDDEPRDTIARQRCCYMSTELGPGGQNPFLALWTAMRPGKRVHFPIPSTRREDLEFLADLAARGKFAPLIDRHYSLADIREAHRYVDSGSKTGNVVIDVV